MDPNELLAFLRELVKPVYENGRTKDGVNATDFEDDFATLFTNLDDWLTRGGFLPDAWKNTIGHEHWQAVLSSANKRAYEKGRLEALAAIAGDR
jgi:hypothetical protein